MVDSSEPNFKSCQAKALCKKAMDQLNDLLQLEDANYSFDMKRIKDTAEAGMFQTLPATSAVCLRFV